MKWGKKERTYLDWASAAPVSKAAGDAFVEAMAAYGNPSAPHAEGRAAKDILEDARVRIARLAEVKADSVVFTSGATEVNNLAILGSVQAWKAVNGLGGEKPHVLYLPTAHASVVETVQSLEAKGAEIEAITLVDGMPMLEMLKAQVRPETVLVCMDAVCGETGSRYDTRRVRQMLDGVRKGILLHVDASQLPLIESFEQTRIGADLMTLDAQKVGGMRGIGALIVRHGTPLSPILHGGGQEQGMRPGTESPALAAAFAAALEECAKERDAFSERAAKLRAALVEKIQAAFPHTLINGGGINGKDVVPHILNLSFPNRDTDYAVALLDEEGFAVSTKSACETDAEGSRVVFAQTGDVIRAASTLRISWGPSTKAGDLEPFGDALLRTLRFLDTPSP